MVRITGVLDGQTLLAGERRIALAGVAVTDEKSAKALLEWTVVSRWVMVEEAAGGHLVYRSPDALFVNRELVTRGYARATLPEIEPASTLIVTYLGTLNPTTAAPLPAQAPARTAPAAGSGSGTRSRSSSSRSRSPRPQPRSRAGAARPSGPSGGR